MSKITKDEFKILYNLPLDVKIKKTEKRIVEWVNFFGEDGVYISFSGGKDSTVLLNIARKLYPELKACFIDTGLEYPGIREYVKSYDNVDIIKPKNSFKQIINKYGYPVLSKEYSSRIEYARKARDKGDYEKFKKIAFGERINKTTGEKYYFNKGGDLFEKMLESPFLISNKCCYHLKKSPSRKYEKDTNRKPILGTLAEESVLRKTEYLKYGCNSFEQKQRSVPLSFWKEQDILRYLKENNISIASPYGEIVSKDDKLICSGLQRTGCAFCLFGLHLEKEPNRIQILKQLEPKIYDYCLKSKDEGGLGLKEILDYMNIPY